MWLRIPSTSLPSAPAAADWNSPSSSVWMRLASSALWRGKPTRPQSWRRAWTMASWTTHLSGAMCDPSTADAGVDAWICSLRAIRANRFRRRASAAAKKIRATSGHMSSASSTKPASKSSSSKMSAHISPSASTPFGETFASVVLRLRQDCLRRQKQARRRDGNACLSSRWPTATASDASDASDASGSRNATQPRQAGSKHHAGVTLNDAAAMWPTPQAHDAVGGKTPEQVQAMRQRTGAGVSNLNEVAAQWGSPTVADIQGGRKNRSAERSGELLLNGQAAAVAVSLSSPRAPTTPKAGAKSSAGTERLSPRFVEWLMGWPDGWSAFAFSATEWFHWKARMRLQLSALVSRPVEVPERQLSWLASTPHSTRKFVGEG